MTADRNASNEAGIRERAYHLWLEEGRPHGRHDEHWRRAECELIDPQIGFAEGSSVTAARRGENEPAVAAEPAGAGRSRGKFQAPSQSQAKPRATRSRQPTEGSTMGAPSRASRRPAIAKQAD
jgi:hypothetical protein